MFQCTRIAMTSFWTCRFWDSILFSKYKGQYIDEEDINVEVHGAEPCDIKQ